jgi:hypothetical protein
MNPHRADLAPSDFAQQSTDQSTPHRPTARSPPPGSTLCEARFCAAHCSSIRALRGFSAAGVHLRAARLRTPDSAHPRLRAPPTPRTPDSANRPTPRTARFRAARQSALRGSAPPASARPGSPPPDSAAIPPYAPPAFAQPTARQSALRGFSRRRSPPHRPPPHRPSIHTARLRAARLRTARLRAPRASTPRASAQPTPVNPRCADSAPPAFASAPPDSAHRGAPRGWARRGPHTAGRKSAGGPAPATMATAETRR